MKRWNISMSKVLCFSFAALLAATSTFAIPQDPCAPKCDVCCEKPAPGPMAFTYPKDVGLSCPSDFYIFGEFLLMQAQEGGLEYAVKGGDNAMRRIQGQGTNHHDWNWNPGFRIGIGGYACHDHWNVAATWTYFRVKDTASTTDTIQPLFLLGSDNDYTYGSEKWKAKLNTLDLTFGKPYYISRQVIWNPYFGLRGTWIDQDIHVNYKGAGNESDVYASNDFWGVGLRAGLESEWILGAGWKIIGTASGSLLFGRFDLSQDNTVVTGEGDAYNLHQENYQIAPNFELGLALNWGMHFCCKKYYVNFQAGYEFQYWLAQNQMHRFFHHNDYETLEKVASDYLSLSGFAFRLGFDF